MQVMLMRLMSKGEYLIIPKGTKFKGSGKLGLTLIYLKSTFGQARFLMNNNQCCSQVHLFRVQDQDRVLSSQVKDHHQVLSI